MTKYNINRAACCDSSLQLRLRNLFVNKVVMKKKKKKRLSAFNLTKNKIKGPEQRTQTLPEITPTDNAKI